MSLPNIESFVKYATMQNVGCMRAIAHVHQGKSPSHGPSTLPAPERIGEEDECRDNEEYVRLLKIADARLLTSQNLSKPSGPVAPRCVIRYPHRTEPQELWVHTLSWVLLMSPSVWGRRGSLLKFSELI